jgi:hypothetical protein
LVFGPSGGLTEAAGLRDWRTYNDLTRRLPQRGHIIRSRKPESGMLRPRVQERLKAQLGLMVALDRRGVGDDALKASRMNAPSGRKRIANRLHLHDNIWRTLGMSGGLPSLPARRGTHRVSAALLFGLAACDLARPRPECRYFQFPWGSGCARRHCDDRGPRRSARSV